MDWQQTTLNGAAASLHPAGPHARRERDPGIAASVAATEPLLAMLDAHLARRRFMAGDAFTMADIPIACEMHRWWACPCSTRPPTSTLVRRHPGAAAARGVLDLPLS